MLRTGTCACHSSLDQRGNSPADDLVGVPVQSGTQWDGPGHVFFGQHMWSDDSCREVSSGGAQRRGVGKAKARMVGRGVLLGAPAFCGGNCLAEGYAIMPVDLGQTGEFQGIGVRRGGCVAVRTSGSPANLLAIM
jgi:hypothetical protein